MFQKSLPCTLYIRIIIKHIIKKITYLIRQHPDFIKYWVYRSTSLSSTCKWYYTVRAHIVTASHYWSVIYHSCEIHILWTCLNPFKMSKNIWKLLVNCLIGIIQREGTWSCFINSYISADILYQNCTFCMIQYCVIE